MNNAKESYRTIKALVLAFVHECKGRVDYDAVTHEVRLHFSASKWQRTHWAWYRSQIVRGRFKAQFSSRSAQPWHREGTLMFMLPPRPRPRIWQAMSPSRYEGPILKPSGPEMPC